MTAPKQPPSSKVLIPGVTTVGWLKVLKYGEVKTQCQCSGGGVYECGRVILRSTPALRAALLKAAEAKCKTCERQERNKRMFPRVKQKAHREIKGP